MTRSDRSAAGDEAAFAELFHQHKNLVYKTAYLLLDDPAEAEDALQEVFMRVHGALDSYDPARGAFTTWLYRITVNHCLNRRRGQRPVVGALDEGIPPRRANGHHRPPETQVETDQTIRRALGRLSEKLRAVVVLRYFWNLPYAEIAEVMDIPVGTVKSRLNLALTTLREEAGDPHHEEVTR
jgi:RNA polymerase sigma-70 factor (ECF subfamily)